MDGHWQPRLLIGRKINGRYELLEPFACGGMGVVFRATDHQTQKPVAVKVLHPKNAFDPEMVRRFCAEADALSGLDHPCVVRIIESGVEPGLSPWIAMELVEGEDLARRLQRCRSRGERGLSTEEVLTIGIDIADALVAVHSRGRVHRDVKPSNIVTNPLTGRSKLVDFGISKRLAGGEEDIESITRPGAFVGTEDYAAPEQNEGEAKPASDVYSLGLTLAEALGGGPRRDAEGKYRGWLNVVRPLIGRGEPDRLVDLLSKALHDRPELRPKAAVLREELKETLAEWASGVRAAPRRPRSIEIDRAAETRAPQGFGDRAPRLEVGPERLGSDPPRGAAGTARSRPRLTPVPRTGISRVFAALLAAVVTFALAGAAAWAFGLDPRTLWMDQSPTPAPIPEIDARAGEQAARMVGAKAAIQALGAAFERDAQGPPRGREARLRYDCSRMRRLSYEVGALDHPLASEGRDQLTQLFSTYGKRCERLSTKPRGKASYSL